MLREMLEEEKKLSTSRTRTFKNCVHVAVPSKEGEKNYFIMIL